MSTVHGCSCIQSQSRMSTVHGCSCIQVSRECLQFMVVPVYKFIENVYSSQLFLLMFMVITVYKSVENVF